MVLARDVAEGAGAFVDGDAPELGLGAQSVLQGVTVDVAGDDGAADAAVFVDADSAGVGDGSVVLGLDGDRHGRARRDGAVADLDVEGVGAVFVQAGGVGDGAGFGVDGGGAGES